VKGTFMNNQFENALYSINQENYVKGELAQNKFIHLSKLKNVGINKDEEEYILRIVEKNPELKGSLINEYYITDKLKDDLNELCSLIKENGEKNIPTNLKENELLMTFGEDDIKILLESMDLSDKDFAFINCNYIPMSLINKFAEQEKKEIKSIASNLFDECERKIEEEKKLAEKNEEDKNIKKEPNKKKDNKNKNKKFLDLKYPKREGEKVMKKIMESIVFENINEKRETLKEVYEKKVFKKLKNIFENEILELIKLKELREKEAEKEIEKEKKEDSKEGKGTKGDADNKKIKNKK
jgi:hypothetical protein